ncbi:MAG: glutathione S-transferase family protein [Hyphomicrobiaceae bacterium]
MITLYGFGRLYGLPDPSPFVSKAEVLLKLAGLGYRRDETGFNKAPKGKLPYINDGGTIIADSTFIRAHLEQRHGANFEQGLDAQQKAVAWAVEKMCEEHLYWAIMDSRWMVDANFDKGPRRYFDKAPRLVRPFIVAMVRRQVRSALKAQGLGRHSRAEIEQLAKRDIDAIAVILGDKPWLMGAEPCGADASVWSFVASLLCPRFESPMREATAAHANLVAYRDRGMARWFPDLAEQA